MTEVLGGTYTVICEFKATVLRTDYKYRSFTVRRRQKNRRFVAHSGIYNRSEAGKKYCR